MYIKDKIISNIDEELDTKVLVKIAQNGGKQGDMTNVMKEGLWL